MKRIAILGGSGFVGEYLVNQLLQDGYFVKLISRSQSKKILNSNSCQVVIDLESNTLSDELRDCDCVIYNIGIIREFPNQKISFKRLHEDLAIHSINMASNAGVRKFILMSANGVDRCMTGYEKTKFKAEKYLMNSNLEWTIFRPSLIFGDPMAKMEFCTQVKKQMVLTPFPLPMFFSGINIFNAGLFRMSPIHVKNVAQFFSKSINRESTNFKIYKLGGSADFTWKEILQIISKSINKNKWIIPVPIFPIKFLAFAFDRFKWFPITRDQIKMLIEGNTCDSKDYFFDFDIDEIVFNSKSLEYLN